ncbi:MAG: glycogen synthase GlgA [Desulfobulbaceae bacterium]
MGRTPTGSRPIRNLWMVTREYDGLAGAGGVKDVCRQLSETLAGRGKVRVRVVLPRYGFMDATRLGFRSLKPLCPVTGQGGDVVRFDVDMHYAGENRRERVSILRREMRGVTVYLVEAERFAEKLGVYTYTAAEEHLRSWQRRGMGHYDYFAMNVLLQKAALGLMLVLDERPDIVHCQDGHTAILPAMMREIEGYRHFFRNTGTVVTIHNAGIGYHQEVGDLHFARAITGLPDQVINAGLLGGSFDPFMAAAPYAVLNTVSENYARELQETPEDGRTGWLGHNLRQAGITLEGITNGINPSDFDPRKGTRLGLPASFDILKRKLTGKRICKEALLRALSIPRKRARVKQVGRLTMDPDQPLVTFIGRLTEQKGVDQLVACFTTGLMKENTGFGLVVLGDGDPVMESHLAAMAEGEEYAGRMCFLKGYDPDLALRIYAAGDFFVMPSLYEPCGLTDYIAQLMGNLPVVRHVGGLVKVEDGETGFAYEEHSPAALAETLGRALTLYREDPDAILAMQQRAVRRIHERYSWEHVMGRYLELYAKAREKACLDAEHDPGG